MNKEQMISEIAAIQRDLGRLAKDLLDVELDGLQFASIDGLLESANNSLTQASKELEASKQEPVVTERFGVLDERTYHCYKCGEPTPNLEKTLLDTYGPNDHAILYARKQHDEGFIFSAFCEDCAKAEGFS